ncbi:helix-turn-helix domain-containing protein [Pseudomonas sp. F1_0610]|uniref:helix-turn-helix domain-containing protein n=1 Tax=Pseudomonas sp. F1_0610 TaxID=3114284 RepID=UPI0039C38E00
MEQSGVLGLSIQGSAEQITDFRSAPFCTPQVFADMLGVTKDTVRGWIENSHIPTIKIGRLRIINLHQIRKEIDHGKTIFCAGDYNDD